MSAEFHQPVDEYLSALFEMREEGVDTIRARVATRLGHSPAAISEMVTRLRGEGWVQLSGRTIELTAKGEARAVSVVRKHRLAECLLTDVIGLDWVRTHAEAGRWEHVISDEVEGLLVTLLGDPVTCPHGNPIPGREAAPAKKSKGAKAAAPPVSTPLLEAHQGDKVHVVRIVEWVETEPDVLSFMAGHGLVPGAEALVVDRTPDGTMMLEVDGRPVALGVQLAGSIYVA